MSLSLLTGSVPPEVFSQGHPVKPASVSAPGRVFQPTFSSWQDFYGWIHAFPEFQKGNLAASTLETSASEVQILLQAMPLLKEGPVTAKRQGNRIALIPALPSDPRQPVFIELPAQGSYSEKVLALAQELQDARQKAWKYSETRYIDQVLAEFYEGSAGLSREEILGAGSSVPAGIFARPNSESEDLWILLERRLGMAFRLNLHAGRVEDWKRETAEMLRNYPQMSMEKALAEAFAKVHSLEPSAKGLAEDFIMHSKLEIGDGSKLRYLLKAGGKYYGITQKKIYEYESGWKELEMPGVGISKFELNGKEYIFADDGLYAKDIGRFPERVSWHPEYSDHDPSTGYIWQVVVREGTAFLAAEKGLFAVDENGLRPEFLEAGWFYRIVELNGRLFATTRKGLYILKKGKWEPASERDGVYALHHPGTLPPGWKKSMLEEIGAQIENASQAASKADLVPPLSSDPEGNIIGEDGRVLFSGFQRTAGFFLGLLSAGALEGLSRLALSLGNLSLGFGEAGYSSASVDARRDIWPDLERWIQEGLDLKVSGKTEEWKKVAAEILRSEPSLPLSKALSRGFARTYVLSPEIQTKIEFFLANPGIRRELKNTNVYSVDRLGDALHVITDNGLHKFIKGGRTVPVLTGAGDVREITRIGKVAYVRAAGGFYKLKGGRAVRVLARAWGVNKIARIGNSIYVGGDRGLYKLKGRRAVPVLTDAGRVWEITQIGDVVYVGADQGIYQLEGDRAVRALTINVPAAYEITQIGNVVYVRAAGGLYRLEGDRAVPVLSDDFGVSEITQIGNSIYVSARQGLYKLKGGRTLRVLTHAGRVWETTQIGDVVYVRAEKGLYKLKGDKAVPVLKGVDIHQIRAWNGKIYLSTSKEGFWIWHPLPKNLKSWQQSVLEEVSKSIGEMQGTPETDSSKEPFKADEKGSILGEDGRTLFSGLQRTAGVFLGLLSAGALEGLSRLALSLGNLSLGFGEGEMASHSSPEGEEGGDSSEEGAGKTSGDPLEALLEAYRVPSSERNLRKKLTLQAVERIKTDIALFTGDPHVRVQFGDWWVTGQSLDGSYKIISIPLEDIFIRAVDEKGVEEAVGAAIHETLHYLVTRADPNSPLIQKYALTESPKANNLLYQSVEDTRINAWGLLKQPGFTPYMDSMYEAEWPENPGDSEALKRARLGILSRSALEIEFPDKKKKSWVAPHIQYANSIIYYWRHRKAPPFLTDPLAKEVFEKTKDSLDRIRNIHPREMGGILLEEMKKRAGTEALETLDREIYPHYEKLVKKSKEELQEMLEKGAKARRSQGQGSRGRGKPQKGQGGSSSSQSQVDDLLDEIAEELAEKIHGHVGDKKEGKEGRLKGQKPEGKEEAPGKKQAEPGKGIGKEDDDSWIKRREQAVKEDQRLEKSWTTYERYKLRAKELGLIDKVDGIIKKILLPTTHVRLSRNHYHEGDEPDLDKYLDDMAQGRLDTPVMKVWNRRIRRSAKISLVLDVSGSMGSMTEAMDSPLDYGILGIVGWAEVCQKNNLDFEVILFDHAQHVIHPFGKTVNTKAKEHIIEQIARLQGGSTAIGEAFRLALSNILKQRATHRFIIFATDEEHNTGDAPETWMPEAKKNKIVTIAMVIGAGETGYKHFDYAVRVERAEDFPKDLLNVLKAAIRSILGPLGWMR